MRFDPILAEKRFGYGLSPDVAPPSSVRAMLRGLDRIDPIETALPVETMDQFRERMKDAEAQWQIRRKNRGTPEAERAMKALKIVKRNARQIHRRWLVHTVLRRTWTENGFRERLVAFWADHFTAQGKAGVLKRGTPPFVEQFVRPNITGKFGDLLVASVTNLLMVHYLDQQTSMGLNSPKAERRGSKAGLNENLAREVLELHTIGVRADYTQTDVRELAELLAGLSYSAKQGAVFRKDHAEPGAETVLGKSYGGGKPHLRDIHAVLQDLALRPETAQHLSWKLAVHFLSDDPPADLIERMARRYLETDGDLSKVYAVLLKDPASWNPDLRNVKLPVEFISSAMRALAVPQSIVDRSKDAGALEKAVESLFMRPLARMGQPWYSAAGPDGWEEADLAWMTPQGLSARLEWAANVPPLLRDPLPDPRVFVGQALGDEAPDAVRFAAKAAENRREAVALILCSPAFQRK